MKSYEERVEDALTVILRALQAMDDRMIEGGLCFLSYENAATIARVLQNQKRRFERSKPPEG